MLKRVSCLRVCLVNIYREFIRHNIMEESAIWKIINKYFEDNPQALVNHHVDSYNDFYKHGIFQIFKEKNPITLYSEQDKDTKEYKHECKLYMGGKDGSKIYFGKPVIYDNNNPRFMFPNESRLRDMSYSMSIHYDVEVEFSDTYSPGEILQNGGAQEIEQSIYPDDFQSGGAPKPIKRITKKKAEPVQVELTTQQAKELKENLNEGFDGKTLKRSHVLKRIYLGRFPIMLQSDFCVLRGLPREIRYAMGECKNDLGGYFIIDGKEKTIVSQEKFADNMLYVKKSTDDIHLYSAELRSVSENISKPVRTMSVRIKAPTNKFTFKNIVVNIPNVRAPVPLFIVFRALGVISDKSIISHCLLDMEKYESMIDLFIPSVHDASSINNQQNALQYIALLTKSKGIRHALEILNDYFLPHIGEDNYIEKAYYLGHIVFKLLSVYTGLEPPTDRDSFKFKRVELIGDLLSDLYREYWSMQLRAVQLTFEKKLYYNLEMYESNLFGLIVENFQEAFQERILETGFKKAFKGNWGAHSHTKRIGIVQDLNRLSFNSAINHLRKTNLPLDSSVKLVGPRVLHNSQWGFIDPIDTPDGGSIGLHKHLSISTYITRGVSREPIIAWLKEKWSLKPICEYNSQQLSKLTKVFVNGFWAGMIDQPEECIRVYNLYRRNALVPTFSSASFDIRQNTVFVCTDGGRLCRPVFYRDEMSKKASYSPKQIANSIENGEFTWSDLICGFNEKQPDAKLDPSEMKIYELGDLYTGVNGETNPAKLEKFLSNKAIIDYIDNNVSENALIALDVEAFESGKLKDQNKSNTQPISDLKKYTHCEIHNSLIFGMMSNLIVFPENNPATRNSFSCGQSKQACSLYHTNYQNRMDKTAVILNNGQIPLVKSRYMDVITKEENVYGENAIVAIACYTGYNVEDAILVNEASLKRGLFRTSYFNSYEAHEETTQNANSLVDKKFMNIEKEPLVRGLKEGYDYSKLDEYGIIREGSFVNDKTVLIGLVTVTAPPPGSAIDMSMNYVDASKTPKKGQMGIVDKVFITDDEEGRRIAKGRILETRIPTLGDKMASRAGQKGTVGNVIPERDMPFTNSGIRPDLVINPHAIPSRMTIGQLVECIMGKACALQGGFGDCTAFNNKGLKVGVFGEMLTKLGYHSNGNEILYDGMNGMQMESEIFMGPTYYMRLKHMVKDKVNYRALGPRTSLTKQSVGGRANDGGLRIGEMERDTVISHGTAGFLQESMMDRGDKYYMAICNHTGTISVYNPAQDLFMSPMVDGPLRFVGSLENSDELRLEHITKYGRSFSVVEVPYSFKLLIQELQTINIQMRVITEDNINQITEMSSGNNVKRLLGEDKNVRSIIDMIRENIRKTTGEKIFTPDDALFTATPDEKSESYHPISPDEKSESYHPISPDEKSVSNQSDEEESMEFIPASPNTPPPGARPPSPDTPPFIAQQRAKEESEKINLPRGYAIDTPSTDDSFIPPPPMEDGEVEDIIKGGKLCLKDDVENPIRIWNVKHVGDRFVTVQTDDDLGISREDMVRVVDRDQICSMEEAQRFYNDLHRQKEPNFSSSTPNANMPPIIIAPKFFNGNGSDNSVGGLEDMAIPNNIAPQNKEVSIVEPTISEPETISNVVNSGEINFSDGLKIKKLDS